MTTAIECTSRALYRTCGILILLAIAAHAENTDAARLSFTQLWALAQVRSPTLSAANHETEAARIHERRLSRHWYPRVFADARAFSTNDPAFSFSSQLGTRQILASDFAPAALNDPGQHVFGQVTLGLDLPLYEGGAPVAAHEAATRMVEARDLERQASYLSAYAELSENYASLLILNEERTELEKLGASVEDTLSRYQVGARANPVGYSGLLGLKTLKNRISGLLIENTTQALAARQTLENRTGALPDNWRPAEVDASAFIAEYLTTGPGSRDDARPAAVRAAQAGAQSLHYNEQAEKARLLPQVGLFADGHFYDGNRGGPPATQPGPTYAGIFFLPPVSEVSVKPNTSQRRLMREPRGRINRLESNEAGPGPPPMRSPASCSSSMKVSRFSRNRPESRGSCSAAARSTHYSGSKFWPAELICLPNAHAQEASS